MVKYVYDAWGKFLSTTGSLASTLGTIQPFRYRSYVYDQETGLYYLRSRYYNPVWKRFVNADILIGINLFKYCNNNPVSHFDPTGNTYESINFAPLAYLKNLTENTRIRNYNCYGFAIGKDYFNSPGGDLRKDKYATGFGLSVIATYFDVNDMAQAVINDLGGSRNAKIVDNINSEVPNGWYMIALRTTKEDEWNPKRMFIFGNDFHFMRRHENLWKHKRGSGPIQTLDKNKTPESPNAWPSAFDSEIVYLIIREDWN